MGFIHVPVTVRSFERIDAAYAARFLVDTGAMDSLAPASELRRIGVVPEGRLTCELADGSVQDFEFGFARIEVMDRVTAGRLLFGPDGIEPLLGVITLESLGVIIDPLTQTLRRLPTFRLKPLEAART